MKRARELLDVATELFISKGIDETTIDDIAAQAGIAKGTFYHHYESKAALLLAIRESVTEDFDGHIESEMAKQASSDDPVVRLDTWVRATCEAYAMIIRRQDIGYASAGFRWTPREQSHIKELVALLKDGNARGCWNVKDLFRTAIFIQKGMLGVMDDMVLAGKSLKGVHRDVVDLVHHAVGL
ncbi:TetR/AcrR family transcriptional regulator [Xylella fastidiosa]|uniref:TetR/AcrR family transcriptional regulator n=1 Tax=Xylella fastidiosa TaxID=2371 RepID=A0ABD7BY68_XYLFS|nr:TetR/AcrR family transcriptional regulator [Xylella fastidiosa]QPB72558.1 TetR/AcrR family transcriptional regulator [Xylella fastidiosa]